ncbi:MAG: surface presentation of antigens family protein [Candidatus Xenolissoclinum pacificiensis L6]|uniref:Surface presentation of antigens family protein n=1 Tax=Candidatus Xenolissoclinum pacificiensis L6 TaxID=1401685 RepID=W2V1I3_9RICK|nr:MAG: surface presentation of antigens family protein [Candidatus Xenolissoclinum pacificiensis L6]
MTNQVKGDDVKSVERENMTDKQGISHAEKVKQRVDIQEVSGNEDSHHNEELDVQENDVKTSYEGQEKIMESTIGNIAVNVFLVLAKRSMTLKEVTDLSVGDVIACNGSLKEMEIFVGDQCVAKGEVMTDNNEIKVKIVEVF